MDRRKTDAGSFRGKRIQINLRGCPYNRGAGIVVSDGVSSITFRRILAKEVLASLPKTFKGPGPLLVATGLCHFSAIQSNLHLITNLPRLRQMLIDLREIGSERL